ncbi:MAG: hypothetical protein ACK5NW_12020 [Ottowia sp.]
MSVQTLSKATQDVVTHYQHAGQSLNDLWSSRSQRVLAATQKRLDKAVSNARLPWLKDGAKSKVIGAQSRVIGGVVRGCEFRSSQTHKLLDWTANVLHRGIAGTAKVAERVDAALPGHLINKASEASLPVAHLSLFAAAAVDSGVRRLGRRAHSSGKQEATATKAHAAPRTTAKRKPATKAAVKPAAKAAARQRAAKKA